MSGQVETAVFGGGCFWCTEAVFSELKGVISVMPGYTGGFVPNPSYEAVSSGATGHAEVSKIEFDPKQITYNDLLTVFFATHDPTTLNRQGADVGTQYRSAIFTTNEQQKAEAEKFIQELDSNEPGQKIVTEVVPFQDFYAADESHRQYYLRNSEQSYCQVVISPKIEKLKNKFDALLKK
jgi:peptide-methionine (S)-S-oxide reductase